MDDFGDFDFGFDVHYVEVDIRGLVKKAKSKERRLFNITRDKNQIEALVGEPPKRNEVYKMLSMGGFSSLGIISWIANREGIKSLWVSTFRIGKNHFNELVRLRERGMLGDCHFITSQTQERVDDKATYKGTEYNYYDYILKRCDEFGWEIKSFDNHSKVILMETANNFYVVETSSNLNENPKIEQFNWENDKSLFDWYLELFRELMR